jgi:hypothetical protein
MAFIQEYRFHHLNLVSLLTLKVIEMFYFQVDFYVDFRNRVYLFGNLVNFERPYFYHLFVLKFLLAIANILKVL